MRNSVAFYMIIKGTIATNWLLYVCLQVQQCLSISKKGQFYIQVCTLFMPSCRISVYSYKNNSITTVGDTSYCSWKGHVMLFQEDMLSQMLLERTDKSFPILILIDSSLIKITFASFTVLSWVFSGGLWVGIYWK